MPMIEMQNQSGIKCINCGCDMPVTDIIVYHDRKQEDRFIDVVYTCKSCRRVKVGRYSSEYIFCNMHKCEDLLNYNVDMENREIAFQISETF